MKKTLSLILALAMTVMCIAAFVSCGAETGDTLYIGVYEPASGDNGAGGKQETLGIKYANSVKNTVTVGGKEYKLELVIVDNQSSNDKAVSAATELINKNACVVLGSYGSGVSIAASDTFKDAGMPCIGVTCTNPLVTEGNSHYFRVCFLDPFQGTVLANYAKDLGAQKAYVLAQLGNDYDVGLAKYFREAFGDSNCIYETFPANNDDFNAYVQKAIDNNCSVIFAPTSTSYAQKIIDIAKSKNYTGTILAGDTWDSNVIVDAAKGSSLNVHVSTFYQEGAAPEFDSGFTAWLNADANRIAENGGNDMVAAVSVMGYDAYLTAVAAIEKCSAIGNVATTRQNIMAALAGMTSAEAGCTGVSGTIYFDAKGDAVRDTAVIKKVDNAAANWTFVKTQKVG